MAEAIGAAWDAAPDTSVIYILDCTEESVAREVESIEKLFFLAKPFSLKSLAGSVKSALDVSRRFNG